MNEVKVSVIMPVYNVEKYLVETLECLICQSLTEIEIICVDDGSTDASLKILNQYAQKDSRIKIIHQTNLYAGVARNAGLKIANGEFVIFLDSDDLFDKELLEKTYDRGKRENADIVLFDGDYFDTRTGEHKGVNHLLKIERVKDLTVFSRKDIPDEIFTIVTPCPWTKLYRREFILKNGLKFQNLKNSNDAFFVLSSLALAERITYVNEKLVYYRVNQTENLQTQKRKDPTLFFKAYEAVFDLLNERNIYSEVEKSFVAVFMSGIVYNLDSVHSLDSKKKIYLELNNTYFKKIRLLDYPEEFYLNKKNYQKLKSVPAILKCIEKRESKEENEFRIVCKSAIENIPKVSVIIPVYNTEKYLVDCLDSILNQSLLDIEIICVNDGSTDSSLEILKKKAKIDSRVSVYSQKNSGLSITRNNGLKAARGKYIYFMDSDDLLEITALEKLYNYAEESNLEIVLFDGQGFLDEHLEGEAKNQNLDYYQRKYCYAGIYTGAKLFGNMVENDECRASACLQFFQRNFLEKNNLLFEEGILHEDNLFHFQCMMLAIRTGHFHEKLFKRRYREASIMTQKKIFEHAYGYFKCYIKMIEFLTSVCIDEEDKEQAIKFTKSTLNSARNIYICLENEEKEAVNGLELTEKSQFEAYIIDWMYERQQVLMLRNREEYLRSQIVAVKNTITFRIGAAIIWLPRQLKLRLLKK